MQLRILKRRENMVDFHKALKELRIWKIRKINAKCKCMAERARTCYLMEVDSENISESKVCKCKCHAH